MKLYEEPQFDEEGNFKKEPISEETMSLKLQMAMKEGVLKTNLGVPLVIVVNKSDIVSQTGERKRFEEDSEFMLKHIRNFALAYGATIIYTSTKQNLNLNVLYEYILHRIYKFEFRHKPNIMDKDSYFIPAGYDSLSVLKNFDIQNELQLLYEDRVPYVKPKNVIKEEEIVCEDVNLFLRRFVDKGQKLTSAHSRRNVSSDYATEERQSLPNDDSRASVNRESTSDNKDNFSSNNKVNFDIFKNPNKPTTSIDVSSYKNASTADKLVIYYFF
jgi:dynein light intermediate chain 1